MTKLEKAAQQALDALEEMFYCNSTKVAVEHYNTAHDALREALYHFRDATEKVVEQAEQEPVAWVKFQNGEITHAELSDGSGSDMDLSDWTPLYAAPVRTKDLTEDEIYDIGDSLNKYLTTFFYDFARAVIAADREKNK